MKRFRLPHPLVLLVGGVALAAALTYALPAGQYQRTHDPATGRNVVVAGTWHRVASAHVDPFQAVVAIPKGMVDAGDVIFFVFLVGGAFAVVDRTGALRRSLQRLVRFLGHREHLVLPIACLAFAAAGALENMQEEIIALVPVLLLLMRGLGYDRLTAAAVSVGAAAVGSAFSPVNPFQVGIAQKLAGLPLLSGGLFRTVFLVLALIIWIVGTMRYAARTRVEEREGGLEEGVMHRRDGAVLALVLLAFAIFIYGVIVFQWGFLDMAAVFFVMGVAAGLVGRLGVEGTADAFVEGFRDMAYAGLLIGFARAIYVVLNDGRIVDTIVHGLFHPIAGLPVALSAVGMTGVQALIHIPVPSVSGQAVLTMPLLVPLSDLLGISRQVTILAYQSGAGLMELLTPTNGALMAILAAAGVRYERWLRFVLPLYGLLMALGILAMFVGLAIGLQ